MGGCLGYHAQGANQLPTPLDWRGVLLPAEGWLPQILCSEKRDLLHQVLRCASTNWPIDSTSNQKSNHPICFYIRSATKA